MAKGPHSSPGGYSRYSNTPKKSGPPSDHSGYSSEDDFEGPTLFGSILRTIMAGGAVVAIAILAKIERDQRNGLAPPAYARPRASFQSYAARKPVGGGAAAPRASSSSPPPGGGSYQIKEGDTLYRIALNHGVDPDVLQAMNPELAGRAHAIQVGEYVRVPRS